MSDESKRPEEPEVEGHGSEPLARGSEPLGSEPMRNEDEEPDVEAHGSEPLKKGSEPMGSEPI
jgi:hypothetical protein